MFLGVCLEEFLPPLPSQTNGSGPVVSMPFNVKLYGCCGWDGSKEVDDRRSVASPPSSGAHSWKRIDFEQSERSLIIPTCARLQWEGRDEAISCLSTGTTKSLYTSVSYFLFWHNQSRKLSRHDRIWQVPRTLAKLDKEEVVGRAGMDSVFAFSPASLLLELGVLLGEAVCVGQNSPSKDRVAESG